MKLAIILTSPAETTMKRKGEMGKVKTCANERNAKLALAFYSECSQVSSTRSVVKTCANEWTEIHLRKMCTVIKPLRPADTSPKNRGGI